MLGKIGLLMREKIIPLGYVPFFQFRSELR
jgi:hypothetical protein